MSDLIRANEGNDDFNQTDPSKIHWGKFNMMGRFVDTTTQCQIQCLNSNDYDFPERPQIADLLTRKPVMSPAVRLSLSCERKSVNLSDEFPDAKTQAGCPR